MADEALGGGSGAGEDAADPATSGAKKHKRDDEAGDKSQEGGKAAAAESSDEEEICRFCFEGTEEGQLISPCQCTGGQKFVHLHCLRRWQRMVLVQQPTHPAMQRDDIRHHKCNVCTTEFTCAPPTRHELMQSFTGPEIAALLEEGCIIASVRFLCCERGRE